MAGYCILIPMTLSPVSPSHGPTRGRLVVVEGIDGAGKSTVVAALRAALEAQGRAVVTSSEPTRGKWGSRVRATFDSERLPPAEEARLLVLDRREHVERLVAPALARGDDVLLDRYYPSMVAYQGAAGLPVDALRAANDFAPRPDLLIVLDLPVADAIARIRSRGDRPNAFEQAPALERVRAIFLDFANDGAIVLDARQPASTVAQQAVEALS